MVIILSIFVLAGFVGYYVMERRRIVKGGRLTKGGRLVHRRLPG
jgi:hypothetical protein